ncbi:hypothetical protein [Moraxella bovis]|uniref:Uncharacterized protein n=1 Tax=Moraxella bovis TaxID=476 RepID=A0A378PZM8_MORBO|nr:hypothetical protein [Moraxella bovis]STY93711.1 Uncharacterised protein [Moraxella bovis]STY93723.1 Uncharacterised protein [Moraxella bovis]STY93736.1 Uncharacterised protein [Moraxella bovis]
MPNIYLDEHQIELLQGVLSAEIDRLEEKLQLDVLTREVRDDIAIKIDYLITIQESLVS